MNWKMLTCVLLAAGSITFVSAQNSVSEKEALPAKNPSDVKILSDLGRAYYFRAAAGDTAAVEQGVKCFDECIRLNATDALSRAYRGSLRTMRGRDNGSMEDVDKGIGDMDKAIEMNPANVGVRLVRGINSVALPSVFNRTPIALDDFNWLLSCPPFPHFGPELKATIYCWGGMAYRNADKIDKAKELLNNAIAVAPASDDAKRAQQVLKELK
jgi:tetratricopeptide (TPR) repeat protein